MQMSVEIDEPSKYVEKLERLVEKYKKTLTS